MTNIESSLKRFLKRRVKITLGLVVTFMITGAVGFAEEIAPKDEKDIEYILSLKAGMGKFENKDIDSIKLSLDSSSDIPWIPIEPSEPVEPEKPGESIPSTPLEPARPVNNVITVNGHEVKDDKGYIGEYITTADITNSIDGAVISATGVGKAVNKHTITNNGSNLQTGMEAVLNGKVTNEGKIIVSGNGGTGLFAEKEGTIINAENGNIEAQTGMMIYQSGTGENNGTIVSTGYAVDMQDIKSASTFTNGKKGILNGEIRVDGEKAVFNNNGTINTTKIDIRSKAVLNNFGKIISTGELSLNTDSNDGDNRFTDGKIINESTGKIKGTLIKVGRTDKGGGTVNRGTIEGNIQGDIIDEGGSVVSSSMEGNLYLTGASVTSYDKVAVNEKINIEKLNGNVYSNSALYTAEKNGNAVVMARKNFRELVDDENIAGYFEANFKAGSEDKNNLLDELKNISSKSELEKATNNVLGNSLIPNLKVQTKEMIGFNHASFQDVIKEDSEKDIRVIAGTDYRYKDSKSSNLTGYEDNMYNIYFGADKKINDNLRAGGVFAVGRLTSDYDDGSDREDTFYQAEAFTIYKYQDYKLTTSILGGYADGELDRVMKVGNLKDKYSSDIKTYYAGTYNTLSRYYDFDNFYLEPSAKLNILYLNQDDIDEKGTYAVDVESDDTFSVEAGIGLVLGKDFEYKSNKITLEASANIYHEFAEPYDDLSARMETMSSDKYKISKYEVENVYGDVGVKLKVTNSADTITGFIEGKIIQDDETNYESTVGITYKF